ncbi:MAG: hypothetical protein D6685_07060 [Bacteroidetes bacterium]|nr:MAG: hypothetical protein D6685_07060 [Bacteroidota bacterium]
MKKLKSTEQALGIMVTNRAVHAVLLQEQDGSPVVLRTFTRQRATRVAGQPSAVNTLTDAGAALPDTTDADVTIQFGSGGPSSSDLFLASEFGALDTEADDREGPGPRLQATTFALELGDILAECRDAGYESPTMAFCVGASEVSHMELKVVELARGRRKAEARKAEAAKKEGAADPAAEARRKEPSGPAPTRVSRNDLLDLLREQHTGEVKDECVSFIPMTPSEEGFLRYLAVFPKSTEPVAPTLVEMRAQKTRRLPPVRVLDAEVSLYLGLARLALDAAGALEAETPPNTLVVRAGIEDTQVLFLKGTSLQHFESLRSLTAYDSPETICSRVLLLQDEYGSGEVQHVLLLSEEHEDGLIDSFEMFFPEARVQSLWDLLPPTPSGRLDARQPRGLVAAAAVAMRLLQGRSYDAVFEDVNMLVARLQGRQFRLPVTWDVVAMAVVLFCTVFFFVGRYFSNQHEIQTYRDRLRSIPPELADANVQELQARIDSMQAAYAQHMRALEVMDSLLVGSDLWSRKLDEVVDQAAGVRGIWVSRWEPTGNALDLQGNATSRDRVVSFAERVEGEILSLAFSEIRDWPVYTFRMKVPLRPELPEVTRYLREQAAAAHLARSEAAASPDAPLASATLDEGG